MGKEIKKSLHRVYDNQFENQETIEKRGVSLTIKEIENKYPLEFIYCKSKTFGMCQDEVVNGKNYCRICKYKADFTFSNKVLENVTDNQLDLFYNNQYFLTIFFDSTNNIKLKLYNDFIWIYSSIGWSWIFDLKAMEFAKTMTNDLVQKITDEIEGTLQ